MPLELCHENCRRFIRTSLPLFERVEAKIPTIPQFMAIPSPTGNRSRFVEHAQPNWWQIPTTIWGEAFNTDEGRAFLQSLESTPPISNAIGKWVSIRETGRGSSFDSAIGLAGEFTRSYLFAAGVGRWKPHIFDLIWKQCANYFDPTKSHLTYVLYAPIWGFSGVKRSLSLGDGLEIRRLSHSRVAEIASLDTNLAGVTNELGQRLWTRNFFVKEFKFQKYISNDSSTPNRTPSIMDCTALLNEEVVLLRTLLSEGVAVPTYAFVYDGYPRDAGGGTLKSLCWIPRWHFGVGRLSSQAIAHYARNRARFKKLESRPGWASVMASMRRFAVAWENPFPADSLADIIAALEGLLVRDKTEVGYRLRVRAAHLLASKSDARQRILENIRDGYNYRSRVAHGDFVFDDPKEWDTAKALKRAKGKHGNPFHDVNEVRRLTISLARYYRVAIGKMIRSGQLEIDWAGRGL